MDVEVNDSDWAAIRSQVEGHGGALLNGVTSSPDLYSTVEIRFTAGGAPFVTASGTVVQAFDTSVAVTFDDAGRAAVLASGGPIDAQPAAPLNAPAAATDDEPDDEGDEAEGAERKGYRRGSLDDEPLWKRWASMTKPEKMRVARYGNQAERRIVLKDRDTSLHLQVLNNPGITPREIAGLIKAGRVNSVFLRHVLERSQLMSNRVIAEALVTNPHTPIPVAVRLVDRIPIEMARRIAKSGELRAPVVAAARKRVVRR